MRLEIPVFGQQKSPINRAFRGTYLFYVPIMVEARGIEPLSENADSGLSPSAVSCFLFPVPQPQMTKAEAW